MPHTTFKINVQNTSNYNKISCGTKCHRKNYMTNAQNTTHYYNYTMNAQHATNYNKIAQLMHKMTD